MTSEASWKKEWALLREERDQARRRWRRAATELSIRARDPLGIGALVHSHPIATATLGAAAGALFAKLFLRRGEEKSTPATRETPATWSAVLMTAALQVALPLILRTLKEKLGFDLDPAAPDEPAPPDTANSIRSGKDGSST